MRNGVPWHSLAVGSISSGNSGGRRRPRLSAGVAPTIAPNRVPDGPANYVRSRGRRGRPSLLVHGLASARVRTDKSDEGRARPEPAGNTRRQRASGEAAVAAEVGRVRLYTGALLRRRRRQVEAGADRHHGGNAEQALVSSSRESARAAPYPRTLNMQREPFERRYRAKAGQAGRRPGAGASSGGRRRCRGRDSAVLRRPGQA
jgi:hypothetical protein